MANQQPLDPPPRKTGRRGRLWNWIDRSWKVFADFFASAATRFDSGRQFAVNFLAILATIFVCFVIVQDVFTGSYFIANINVPKSTGADISDPEAVAAELRDEIGLTWKKVFSQSVVKPIVRESDEPVIALSGTSISLRYIATQIRAALHFPVVEVSGQIVEVPNSAAVKGQPNEEPKQARIRMTLRTDDSPAGPFFVEEGPYQQVIADAAISVLGQIDPYAAAGALSQGNESERHKALAIVKEALIYSRSHEMRRWFYKWLPVRSTIPTGELTEANVLLNLDNFKEAVDHFNVANSEFRARSRGGENWYAADDGLAVAYLRMKRFDDAKAAAARSASEKEGGYDSAEYHLAEIDENRLFDEFYDNDNSDFCQAEQLFVSAIAQYDHLLDRHPTFYVAYTQKAELLLRRTNRIRRQPPVFCADSTQSNDEARNISKALARTKDALKLATIEDHDDPLSWFQYANFLYETQEPSLAGSVTDRNERLAILGDAIDKYKTALALLPKDSYIHFRLGQTLHDYALLKNSELKTSMIQDSAKELCEAIKTSGGNDGIVRNSLKLLSDEPSDLAECR